MYVIITAAVSIHLLLRSSVFGWRARRSFGEALRDPKGFEKDAQRRREEQERMLALPIPDHPDEAEIRKHINDLLDEDRCRPAGIWLSHVGVQSAPLLIEALNDPRFIKSTKPGDDWMATTALQRLLQVVEHIGAAETVEAVLPLLSSTSAETRKTAALTIGAIGSENGLPGIKQALKDPDQYVQSYALIGIDRAIAANRTTPGVLRGLFDSLIALIRRGHTDTQKATTLLLSIDREHALRVLLDDGMLNTATRGLAGILAALTEAQVAIPPEKLIALQMQLATAPVEYPYDYQQAALLAAMAVSRMSDLGQRAQALLDSPSETVREGAVDALAELRGVRNARETAWARHERDGWENLALPVRYFLAVGGLEGEVDNGGFSQYFFNSTGDHCRDALAGLQAMGCVKTAALLSEGMSYFGRSRFFGPKGPSPDWNTRRRQLAKLIDDHEADFQRLETEFYADEDRRYVRMMLYVMDNAEHFRPDKNPPATTQPQ